MSLLAGKVTDIAAGTPENLDTPTDDERLLMLAMGESKHKRTSIWHVHVLETSEAAVNASTPWYARVSVTQGDLPIPECSSTGPRWNNVDVNGSLPMKL